MVSFIDQEGNFYNDDNLEATLSCKYDVFGRKIQCSYPKGKGPDGRYLSVFNKTEYTPWEENFYDGNDTSLESEYDRVWRNHTEAESLSDQSQGVSLGEKTEYDRLLGVWTEKEEAAFILDKAEKDRDFVVITPAMPKTAGLDRTLREKLGELTEFRVENGKAHRV